VETVEALLKLYLAKPKLRIGSYEGLDAQEDTGAGVKRGFQAIEGHCEIFYFFREGSYFLYLCSWTVP
jgi:hypothetical protein